MGVRMGTVFQIAKEHAALEPGEIEVLLDSPIHEARAAAVKVMAVQAAARRRPSPAAPSCTSCTCGGTTASTTGTSSTSAPPTSSVATCSTGPATRSYELARSPDLWRRRTAIWATLHFLRNGQVDDTYAIVELVLDDHRDLTHKAAGTMLRTAGVQDRARLVAFLDAHRAAAVAHDAADRHRALPARRAGPLRQARGEVVVLSGGRAAPTVRGP